MAGGSGLGTYGSVTNIGPQVLPRATLQAFNWNKPIMPLREEVGGRGDRGANQQESSICWGTDGACSCALERASFPGTPMPLLPGGWSARCARRMWGTGSERRSRGGKEGGLKGPKRYREQGYQPGVFAETISECIKVV